MSAPTGIVSQSPTLPKEPYIRLAKSNELEEISALACRSFLHDPLFNYYGSCTQVLTETSSVDGQKRQTFLKFLIKICMLIGGRITIMAIPADSDDTKKETIAAVSMWLPPSIRISLWQVLALIRAGAVGVLIGWGLGVLNRLTSEYSDSAHAAQEKAWKAKGIKGSSEESWYLQLACTDPGYQGKGYMSKLIREAYKHAPSSSFTLEATTKNSRDQYAHLGFELLEDVAIGQTKVGSSGLPVPDKNDATGVVFYAMAKVSPGVHCIELSYQTLSDRETC